MVKNDMKISKVSEMDVQNSRNFEFLDGNFHICQKIQIFKFRDRARFMKNWLF